LSDEDVLGALGSIDPLVPVAADLTGDVGTAEPFVSVEDGLRFARPDTELDCLFPTSALTAVHVAALAALAAAHLAPLGVRTAALFAPSHAEATHLTVLVRHVPHISHLAVHRTGDADVPYDNDLLDEFELAGTGLSTTPDARSAASGANLLVLAERADELRLGSPHRGLLLVNASGQDLSDAVLDVVDQAYVDDARLLADNRHRAVVRVHLSGPTTDPIRQAEGWHRHQQHWRTLRRIDADLRQVLAGTHPGRSHADDVLLVELLGTAAAGPRLATTLCEAALELGLGTRVRQDLSR
jgi:ornithine cyclodeaminase/alanine dehydrogenase-like protein (mu-crystallin family)